MVVIISISHDLLLILEKILSSDAEAESLRDDRGYSVIGRSETGIWIEGFSEAVWDDAAPRGICNEQKGVHCLREQLSP